MLKHPRKILFSAKISLHFLHTRERLLCRLWGSLWETINISICYCTRQSASVNKTKQLGGLCDLSSVYFQRFGNGADLIFALSLLTSAQSALDVLRSNIDIGKGNDICYRQISKQIPCIHPTWWFSFVKSFVQRELLQTRVFFS